MKYEVWRVKNDCYTGCKNIKIAEFYSKKEAQNFIKNCEDCCLEKKVMQNIICIEIYIVIVFQSDTKEKL